MIIECFTFSNELELLAFRLKELGDVVDYFILAEATQTHSGKPKELIYQNNKHLFEEYSHKIIHIVVADEMPQGGSWDRECYQREAIYRGIKTLQLQDDDLILVEDCDEIPDSGLVKQIREKGFNIFEDGANEQHKHPDVTMETYSREECFLLDQDMYYYNLECISPDLWPGTRILTFRKLKEIGNTHTARIMEAPHYSRGGWHLSYFGGSDRIVTKLKSYAHTELDQPHITDKDNIKLRVDGYSDLFGRDMGFRKVPIEENNYLPINYKMLLTNDTTA